MRYYRPPVTTDEGNTFYRENRDTIYSEFTNIYATFPVRRFKCKKCNRYCELIVWNDEELPQKCPYGDTTPEWRCEH